MEFQYNSIKYSCASCSYVRLQCPYCKIKQPSIFYLDIWPENSDQDYDVPGQKPLLHKHPQMCCLCKEKKLNKVVCTGCSTAYDSADSFYDTNFIDTKDGLMRYCKECDPKKEERMAIELANPSAKISKTEVREVKEKNGSNCAQCSSNGAYKKCSACRSVSYCSQVCFRFYDLNINRSVKNCIGRNISLYV